ncbi:MAG TPA: nitrate/nitrite transporter NrtS [Actinomycetota bacterium]|nr:nitrate/nitrite transporter NrtS [Actinomycetota bacterium]
MQIREIQRIVRSRAALASCLPTALVVGTILSLINQGSVIQAGDATVATWIRVLFNYLIPLTVSNIGFVSATLASERARPALDAESHE